MVGPGVSESVDCSQSTGERTEAPIADYLETIEVLQEEIARLEQELQLRDVTGFSQESAPDHSLEPDADVPESRRMGAGEAGEIERLQAELAGRDETIVLLLDELSRLDAAQQANRAEWEQFNNWVAELEHRVERQDGDAVHHLENQVVAQQQKAEAVEAESDQDRRDWKAQRQLLQAEISRLQGALDQVASMADEKKDLANEDLSTGGVDSSVVEALQAENVRLRAAWQELVERTSSTESSEAMDARLAESLKERHQLRRRLEQVQDEWKRERLEHEATLAELQARHTQASYTPSQPVHAERHPEGGHRERDLDLRVRALRQHLQEIEQRERQEREERRQKNLIVRLSKLWSRTSPR
jgi:hypothetical protein